VARNTAADALPASVASFAQLATVCSASVRKMHKGTSPPGLLTGVLISWTLLTIACAGVCGQNAEKPKVRAAAEKCNSGQWVLNIFHKTFIS
jgi:hypothetical protein